jgi:hypothetical protein
MHIRGHAGYDETDIEHNREGDLGGLARGGSHGLLASAEKQAGFFGHVDAFCVFAMIP